MRVNEQTTRRLTVGLSWCLAALFGFAALGKIVHWDNFYAFLQEVRLLPIASAGTAALVGIAALVVECVVAVLLVRSRTRRVGAAVAFILSNVLLWFVVMDQMAGHVVEACPCLGWWKLTTVQHALLCLVGGGLALVLFVARDVARGQRLGSAVTLGIYVMYAAGLAWPAATAHASPAEATGPSRDVVMAWWNAGRVPAYRVEAPHLVVFANLGDFSCPACQHSIEKLLALAARDASLADRTLLLVTDPDTVYGERRVEGWLKAQQETLPDHRYITLKQARSLGFQKSSLVFYDEAGATTRFERVPFLPREILYGETEGRKVVLR